MFGSWKQKISKIVEAGEGFWRYNFWKSDDKMYPRSVMISLTYWCNSRCVMCNIWKIRPKNEFKFNDWKRYLNDDVFKEVRNLTITGGEPSMFPEYVKTLKMIIDSLPKLKRITINSNGFTPKLLIGYMKEIAEYCQTKGVRLATSISVDGIGKKHEEIRGIVGGFDKCMETIDGYKKLAKKYNFSVSVTGVLMSQTIESFRELQSWFVKRKIDFNFQIVGFHDTYLDNRDTESKVGVKNHEKQKFLEALKDIRDSKGKWNFIRYYWEDMYSMYKNGTTRTTPCTFLKDDFCIDSFGGIYYCFSAKQIGNVVKEKRTVGEIYFDLNNLEKRRKFSSTVCKKCNSGCNVYYATAWNLKKWIWYVITGKLGGNIS